MSPQLSILGPWGSQPMTNSNDTDYASLPASNERSFTKRRARPGNSKVTGNPTTASLIKITSREKREDVKINAKIILLRV
ncbi:hypothetical protein GWI33_002321 [Rhynchophorus ferrugineus]|uniref:Uncharacterized protein n=1 Tax=Rhynchophorus ferrugineus TaxID=354439 RepID=A0A834IKH5_RHYFE|nr:hypothetical protein GWI33_002321 [Rhynchophorus ferrugineus]